MVKSVDIFFYWAARSRFSIGGAGQYGPLRPYKAPRPWDLLLGRAFVANTGREHGALGMCTRPMLPGGQGRPHHWEREPDHRGLCLVGQGRPVWSRSHCRASAPCSRLPAETEAAFANTIVHQYDRSATRSIRVRQNHERPLAAHTRGPHLPHAPHIHPSQSQRYHGPHHTSSADTVQTSESPQRLQRP